MPKDETQAVKPKKSRVLCAFRWLCTGDDEITVGPRVPARVRVAWGLVVLAALVWLIVMQHVQVEESRKTRAIIVQTLDAPKSAQGQTGD